MVKVADFLSREEVQRFTERSDLRAGAIVAWNWALVALIFAVVELWTNPLTLVLALILLGGRQMGLAVLMHEAGHKTLFRSQRLNVIVGQWFCAYPILSDSEVYGASHREHHRMAGTRDDPDLPNYQEYPVSRERLGRKLRRDLTGQTGFKLLLGFISGGGGSIMMRAGEKSPVLQGTVANLGLFLALTLAGAPELFLLWIGAYLITYPLIARIRQIAEHANVPDLFDVDPRLNTRTTIPRWYERLVFCPNQVNFHVEHHFLASVPCYHLGALHRCLRDKGFYRGYEHTIAHGYRDVLKRALGAGPAMEASAG